jgi:hypothetical protein
MVRIKLAAVLIILPASFCFMAKAQEQLSADSTGRAHPTQLALLQPTGGMFPLGTGSFGPASGPSSSGGLVRTMPAPAPVKEPTDMRPFHSAAIAIKASTLGAGAELATPLSRSFNLRSGFSLISFGYPFTTDGVTYNSQLHLHSSQTTLDWFPTRHGFHISPGILYARNNASSIATVPAGQNFSLGDQSYINSLGDPVHGTMSVVYPHNVSPMLLLGVGNILPRNGRHLSVPFEFGVAYTGAPVINVNLTGSACTNDGCVSFANNAEAQASLKQEIQTLNEDLKRLPVYPILSLGLAYHF